MKSTNGNLSFLDKSSLDNGNISDSRYLDTRQRTDSMEEGPNDSFTDEEGEIIHLKRKR